MREISWCDARVLEYSSVRPSDLNVICVPILKSMQLESVVVIHESQVYTPFKHISGSNAHQGEDELLSCCSRPSRHTALSVSTASGNLIRWCVFHLNPTVVFLTSDTDPRQEEYPDAAVWDLCAETK